jgi:hypothetical protein
MEVIGKASESEASTTWAEPVKTAEGGWLVPEQARGAIEEQQSNNREHATF